MYFYLFSSVNRAGFETVGGAGGRGGGGGVGGAGVVGGQPKRGMTVGRLVRLFKCIKTALL